MGSATVLPFESATLSPDPAINSDTVDNTTLLTSFTTTSGTVSTLGHAIAGNGNFDASGGVRNSWGVAGSEIDGVDAALNLDISTGFINAGDTNDTSTVDVGATGGLTSNFFFSTAINAGIVGDANDFFLVENGGNDDITVIPIDGNGDQIGDFSLSITSSDWGGFPGITYSRAANGLSNGTGSFGGVAFDFEDFTGTGSLSGVAGIAWSGINGLDALVVGVNSTLAPVPEEPALTINRDNGSITFSYPGTAQDPLNIQGYSIKSSFGALDQASWAPVADNYDASNPGPNQIDNDDEWTKLTAAESFSDLSEFEFTGDGGVISPGSTLVLGAPGTWLPSPDESVQMEIILNDGQILEVDVVFEGNGNSQFIRSDLNFDGSISSADWIVLRDGGLSDMSGLSLSQQYALGDLDSDGDNDIHDYQIFRTDYDSVFGQGAFAAMIQSVPEPSSFLLVVLSCTLMAAFGHRRSLGLAIVAVSLQLSVSQIAEATISPFTGVTLSPAANPAGGEYPSDFVDSAAILTSYTTAAGTESRLSAPYFGNGKFLESGGSVRNFWGANRSELDGVPSVLDLDLSSGAVNIGDTDDAGFIDIGNTGVNRAQFFFSQTIDAGVPGEGNDFFFVESGGNDTIDVIPLDASGNQIGDFSLTIDSTMSHWGILPIEFDRVGNAISQLAPGALPNYAGVAFDFEDFSGTGTLSGVAGIGLSGTDGLDAVVIGAHEDISPQVILRAYVHKGTGEIKIRNNSPIEIALSSYQLTSLSADTLDSTNWNSLSNQNLDPVDGGDDTGETWDEVVGSNDSAIAEQFLLGSTSLGQGESVSLGSAFDESIDGDFLFEYFDVSSGVVVEGLVETVLVGDMDNDGDVDNDDVNPFVQALTDRAAFVLAHPSVDADLSGDYNNNGRLDLGDIMGFKAQLANPGTSAFVTVPEPSTVLLLGIFCSMILGFRFPRIAT